MERLKRILEKFLFPRLWVTLLCVPIAAAGLFYVLGGGDQTGVIAYAVYVFSAYALTLVCVRVIKTAKHAKEDTEKLMDRMPLVRRYVEDIPFRMQVSLYQNLGLNMLYAVIKLGFGIYYHSLWFGTLAGYYFSLALMRFVLLRYANKAEFGQNRVAEWNRYRLCGILLLIMNLALSGVVILMIREDEGFHYAGMLIYIMAIYAFYSVTAAIINVVKYRRYHSPVMSAAKVLHLEAALVSMLALETAMLEQFGADNSAKFHAIMTGSTSGGVCSFVLAVALYMICHATKEIRKQQKEEAV